MGVFGGKDKGGDGPGLKPDLGPALKRSPEEPPPAPGKLGTPPPFRLAGMPSVDENFNQAVRVSIGLHIAFAAFVLIKAIVFPGTVPPFVPTLRVDLVGLPDLLKKDLHAPNPADDPIAKAIKQAEKQAQQIKEAQPPAPVKSAAKDAPADPADMILHPKKAAPANDEAKREKKLKSALDRIKALSKVSAEEETAPAPAPILKGNRVSHGSSVEGDAREGEATYPELIREKLHENWALPVVLMRQNLSAQVRIFVDAYGRITRFAFTKGSGNPKFDDEVKRAIMQSQPFPRPPAELVSTLQNGGIEFGFPL